MPTLTFRVSGIPVPWSRPRIARQGHIFNRPELDAWEEQVAAAAAIAARRQGWETPKGDVPVSLEVGCLLRQPKSRSRRTLEAAADTAAVPSRGDGANYYKAVEDGVVKGRVLVDDSQVWRIVCEKYWAAPGREGVEVTVTC